jgi:hypothetical protein
MEGKEVIEIMLDLIREKKPEKTSIREIVKRLDSSPGICTIILRIKYVLIFKIIFE